MRPRVWFVAPVILSAVVSVAAQSVPQPAAPLDWSADDGRRVAELTAKGERREGKLVVLFTPAGAVDDGEEAAMLERLDKGLAELRAVVGRHSWQVVRDEKISYYVSSDRFVSHASGRAAVFIPLARVQDGRAPYLHEAAHELLEAFSEVHESSPLWLTEGLAEYVARTAASRAGTREGDVFDIGGLAGADGACRDRVKGPRGAEVLSSIGSLGAPAALFTTQRAEVAPTFYACGLSFTKYLVGRIGLPQTIGLMPLILKDAVLPRIEELTGKSMAAVRAEWRASIGVQ